MSLEERVKALEDQWQALARVFLAPPQPQQKPAAQPQPATGTFKEATIKNTLSQLDGSIKPIHYINDKELWNQINDDLVAHGFKWLSAGKESRWTKT